MVFAGLFSALVKNLQLNSPSYTIAAQNFDVGNELYSWASANRNLPQNPAQLYDTFTLTGSTYTFANGDYTLTVSDMSTYVQSNGNYLNEVLRSSSDPTNSDYLGGYAGFDWPTLPNYSSGQATSSHPISTTATNNTTYYGSYIQLSLPYSLILKKIQARTQHTNANNTVNGVVLLGSNDNGTTFDLIVQSNFPSTVQTQIETITPTISNTTAYALIRMVITSFHGTGGTAVLDYFNLIGDAVAPPRTWQYEQTLSPTVSNTYDYGAMISISENGLYMAISGGDDNESGGATGYTVVYEYTGGTWQQRGSNITDPNSSDRSYENDISIDNTGTTLIQSEIGNGSNAPGAVAIYKYSNSAWSLYQKIPNLTGTTRFGVEIFASSDGLAFTTSDTQSRIVRYYRFDPTDTSGNANGSYVKKTDVSTSIIGWIHTLTRDGLCCAVGDVNGTFNTCGVFEYDVNSNSWSQKGNSITGSNGNYQFKRGICENKNLCAFGSANVTRVFEYNSGTNTWVQKGSDLSAITSVTGIRPHLVHVYFNKTGTQLIHDDSLYEWDATANSGNGDWVVLNTLQGGYKCLSMNVDGDVIALSNSSAVSGHPTDSVDYTVDMWRFK